MMKRVLVVDDEEAILLALQTFLEARGYHVDICRDLEGAETAVVERDYDVVITDLRLTRRGGGEGLDIIRFVRQQQPNARTILLTAYGSPDVESAAAALNVDKYLQKPISLRELEEVVQNLLLSRRSAGEK